MDNTQTEKEYYYNSIITIISQLKTKKNMDILDWIQSSKGDFNYKQLKEIYNIVNVKHYNKEVSKKLLDYILQNTQEVEDEDEETLMQEEARRISEEEILEEARRIREEEILEEARRISEEERLMQEEAIRIREKEILEDSIQRHKEEKNNKTTKKMKPPKILRFNEVINTISYDYDSNIPRKKSKHNKNPFRKYINRCLEEKNINLEGPLLDDLYIFISNIYSDEKYQRVTRNYTIKHGKSNSKTISIRSKIYDKNFICKLIDNFLKLKSKKITPLTDLEYSNSYNPISKVEKTLSFFKDSFRGGKSIKSKKSKKNKK
jgi:hypothetical protein